jgi:hypothetical protein
MASLTVASQLTWRHLIELKLWDKDIHIIDPMSNLLYMALGESSFYALIGMRLALLSLIAYCDEHIKYKLGSCTSDPFHYIFFASNITCSIPQSLPSLIFQTILCIVCAVSKMQFLITIVITLLARSTYAAQTVLRFGCSQIVVERLDP